VAVALLAVVFWANTYRSQRKETTDMTGEAFKAWLDTMPIDDVRDRIEDLELQLADLRVLERLYALRGAVVASEPIGHGASGADGEPWPEPGGGEPPDPAGGERAWSEPADG
jgi:hypothetical protein